ASSKKRTCLLTAACVTPNSVAARVKLPKRATASNSTNAVSDGTIRLYPLVAFAIFTRWLSYVSPAGSSVRNDLLVRSVKRWVTIAKGASLHRKAHDKTTEKPYCAA